MEENTMTPQFWYRIVIKFVQYKYEIYIIEDTVGDGKLNKETRKSELKNEPKYTI